MYKTKVFYISSESNISCPFLDGFAFFGSDLVIGNKAYKEYILKNSTIEDYPDGCCVIINKNYEDITIQRDYHGYYPLYYYNKENFWCISSSILHIIKKLKQKQINIEYDNTNIEIWKSKLALALQASSHYTYIKNIKLLPVGCNIIISNGKLNIELRENSYTHKTYKEALEECLYIWRKRFETVFRNSIGIRMELTGGIDSRTLFSFVAKEKELLNFKYTNNGIFIYSDTNYKEDFHIAKKISDIYNININGTFNKEYRSIPLSSYDSYNNWKYYNIGRYSPIVFPASQFNVNCINFGGEGGEDNRGFYGRNDDGSFLSFDIYLNRYQRYFSKKEFYDKWVNNIYESLDIIKRANTNKNISDSILHYREFRSTHHTSKTPFNKFNCAVLGSKYFHNISQYADKEQIENGQILYDIINNNDNRLLMIQFDKEYKNLTPKNIQNLSYIKNYNDYKYGYIYIYDNNQLPNMEYVEFEPLDDKFNSYNPLQILIFNAIKIINKNKEIFIDILGNEYFHKMEKEISSINPLSNRINLHADGVVLHLCELIQSIAE